MKGEKIVTGVVAYGMMAAVLFGSTAQAAPAYQGTSTVQAFADPAFKNVWSRTDAQVASGQVKRSWYWGPQPNSTPIMEDYAEGPGGKHMVQYFDKSRMEVNNPNGDKNNPFYVTNGLLAKELITGYMQTGNATSVLRWPAEIAVAGDTNVPSGTTPTYSAFRGAIERKDDPALGKIVNAGIGWTGSLDFESGGPNYFNYDRFGVKNVYYEAMTQHNIPDVFWQFLIASGPINVNGKATTGRLNDPYFYATGYPISDAYWASAKIGKDFKPVLIQAYERRVLTYVPDNPAGFKVEMGNVGQHYYDWRYKDAGKPDAIAGRCQTGTPQLGFGKVYNEHDIVKIQLGCQQRGEERDTVEVEAFEHGTMLGVSRYDFYSGHFYEDVFILYPDGTAQTFPLVGTEYFPPTPSPAPPVPSGLFIPSGVFGLVWNSDAKLQQRLGYATELSVAAKAVEGRQGTGGVAQLFYGGMMVYPTTSNAAKKIYVLYNSSGDAYNEVSPHITRVDVNHWNVYDDTLQPR